MSSIALKFTSLAIRTLSKPIANYIKRQAREHPGFRDTCINFAQAVHRVDMRWRIGLLQDAQSLERQAKKDATREAAKKQKASVPTVKTEAETKADEEAASKASTEDAQGEKKRPQPKIRPLSEAKAIETGANFISETFLFSVAAALILFESWRSRRKASNRREDMKERLDDLEESEKAARRALIELEREVLHLRAKDQGTTGSVQKRILPKEVYDPPKDEADSDSSANQSWLTSIAAYLKFKDQAGEETQEALDSNSPGPAERILAESDRALDEKHKQQEAARAAEATAGADKTTKTSDGKS